ncbi:uncharacterized protein G2W53_026907 [Senna tora]|uniref:Uncharacterized protein n=1 Tax=Senna tora TaxID=362788 RepID=A0A834WG32_9FABA|nr:uncharacterized protein G2W53_026907 [Senna tora]
MDFDVDRRGSETLKNQSPMDKMILMTRGSLPRSFKATRVSHPAVDHVDRRPSKINESWPITQGNLPRSLKAIRLARDQIFDGQRLGSPLVSDAQKSIIHGSTFFLFKISRAYVGSKSSL